MSPDKLGESQLGSPQKRSQQLDKTANVNGSQNLGEKRNSKEQKKEQDEIKFKMEQHLICVDPESHQIYTLNLETNEIHIELQVPSMYRMKAEQAITNIERIVNLNSHNWLCASKKAECYRRRKIPIYLLQARSCVYPTYICQSPLSLAFQEVKFLKLEVDLKEYQTTFQLQNINNFIKLIIDVGLVTGADEVLKMIVRKIFEIHKIRLKPKEENHHFILKVSGFREYLYGSTPMLSYDRVRINLRGLKSLPVILTEVEDDNDAAKLFPPIIERNAYDVRQGIFSPVDWDRFLNVPILMWYPPRSLPKFSLEMQQQMLSQEEQKNKKLKKVLKRLKPQEWTQQQQRELQFRVAFKERMELFVIRRREMYQNNVFSIENPTLFSGECDQPFRVKITGVDNLFRLFEQAYEGLPDDLRATYNGILPLKYIAKNYEYQHAEESGEKIKRIPRVIGQLDPKTLKFIRINEKKEKRIKPTLEMNVQSNSNKPRQQYSSLLQEHGSAGTQLFQRLATDFDLDFAPYLVSVQVKLLHGNVQISKIAESRKVPFCNSPRFLQWLEWPDLKISQLPLELRLCFNLIAYSASGMETQVIASTVFEIFNEEGQFNQGLIPLNLWPFYIIDDRLACMGQYWGILDPSIRPKNKDEYTKFCQNEYSRLFVQFDTFNNRMNWSLRDQKCMTLLKMQLQPKKQEQLLEQVPTNDELAYLQKLIQRDPLNRVFTSGERDKLMVCRNHYCTLKDVLEIYLTAVDWTKPDEVGETYRMLRKWAKPMPEDALPLLDVHFADESVRLFAIDKLSQMSDDEMQLYMVELIQCLMFETQHYSPLCEILLERALVNPFVVGHELFWGLRSQLHLRASFERFALILEQMLMLCGLYRDELINEVIVNDGCMKVAKEIKLIKGDEEERQKERVEKASTNLVRLRQKQFGPNFIFAIDNRLQCKDFVKEKINVMNSKKRPLWMVMRNTQENPINNNIMIIFKDGDDIRQDLLTLQLIRIMDKIWLDNGIDYRMKPYKVISTLDQVGMIEIVLNADTTAKIHTKFGGTLGAMKQNTIEQYIREYNDEPEDFERARQNFIYSCAGYCVATYILGIGDRHSDNIMLTRAGHLFHIDFGHFLGNFKSKFGIKRERAPFVFTEEMAFVMGGKNGKLFQEFQVLCCKAYNLIRKHGHFLINIFRLMLSAGMPELQSQEDINYLSTQLSLNISDQEATNKFRREIDESLNATSRKIDNLIHELKRG